MSRELNLELKRVIRAEPETIFNALTKPDILEQWFFATSESATVKANPETGGSFQIDMHDTEATYPHTGTYKEIVPNQKIVFTWNSKAVKDTLVTISLRKVDEGTEITLTHDFLPNKEQVENHTQGWTVILQRLDALMQEKS
ncbi:MAG: SRPBCC domain-containing protein [Balneolaceae bacterium]